MNRLAQFIYQLVRDQKAEETELPKSKRAAVTELQCILQQDPQELARSLRKAEMGAETWLVPPQCATDN